jgi:hypothetical protein
LAFGGCFSEERKCIRLIAFKPHESTRDHASLSPKIDETGRIYMIHDAFATTSIIDAQGAPRGARGSFAADVISGWSASKSWISDAPRVALFRLDLPVATNSPQ